MFYTRKGDSGDTSFFGCHQRFSKSSLKAEALGAVDEANSLLGLCKVKAKDLGIKITKDEILISDIIAEVQNHLFIIQASLAGADKKIAQDEIDYLEKLIDAIEKELPPIKNFTVAGGSELSALFDFARTLARRAERQAVNLKEAEPETVKPEALSYLNRLSSLFYALARIINYKLGVKEDSPSYE